MALTKKSTGYAGKIYYTPNGDASTFTIVERDSLVVSICHNIIDISFFYGILFHSVLFEIIIK